MKIYLIQCLSSKRQTNKSVCMTKNKKQKISNLISYMTKKRQNAKMKCLLSSMVHTRASGDKGTRSIASK